MVTEKRRENGRNWDLVSWGFLFFSFSFNSFGLEWRGGFLGFAHFLVSNYEFCLKTTYFEGFLLFLLYLGDEKMRENGKEI